MLSDENTKNSTEESTDDLYLSDFHVEIQNTTSNTINNQPVYSTRIEFCLPVAAQSQFQTTNQIDSDGDLVIPNRNRLENLKNDVIHIEHSRQTTLDNVGFQLWRASFYLVDFIINENMKTKSEFSIKDRVVVDLGAGLGLTSFFATIFGPKRVYCTDLERFVEIAEKNWRKNESVFNNLIMREHNNMVSNLNLQNCIN